MQKLINEMNSKFDDGDYKRGKVETNYSIDDLSHNFDYHNKGIT